MSIHFHTLRILEIRKETPDCVSVQLEVPAELKDNFRFLAGQSLTLKTHLNNEEVRRTYSLCSSPLDNEWRVAIKKVDGGLFSTFANEILKKGDSIEVMSPVGKFNSPLDPNQKKRYLAFAAGSGITPILSLISTTLATEPYSQFTLVYGNRNRSSIIFFEALEALKNQYMERFTLIYVLSREKTETPINTGRINIEKLEQLGKLINYELLNEVFICGPEEMIFCVRDFLETKSINSRNIHFELFTTPGQEKSNIEKIRPVTAGGPQSKISILLDGRSFDLTIPLQDDTSILDAALKAGADLPFACKGGVCCTCKAKLLEGQVEMDVHWGLEQEEIEQGYILTCQSHPLTDHVVIDFDVK